MNKSGIYRILNIVTGDSYVGSTKNFRIRWNVHKSKLRNGIHHSQHLQNAWNKYGEDSFLFVMIEYCAENKCIERENFYLSTIPCVYNIAPFAEGRRGFNHSEQTKEKIKHSKNKRSVYQFTLGGKLIHKFDSVSDAMRATNVKSTAHIIECCKGKRLFAYGFRWSYTENLTLTDKEHFIIFQYSLDGTLIKEWEGIKQIANFYNLTQDQVRWIIDRDKNKPIRKNKTNILNHFLWQRKE